MIRSFGNAAAAAAWNRRFVKGIPNDILKIANRKLVQIHNALTLGDLRAPPGNRLERVVINLTHSRHGEGSLRIRLG